MNKASFNSALILLSLMSVSMSSSFTLAEDNDQQQQVYCQTQRQSLPNDESMNSDIHPDDVTGEQQRQSNGDIDNVNDPDWTSRGNCDNSDWDGGTDGAWSNEF